MCAHPPHTPSVHRFFLSQLGSDVQLVARTTVNAVATLGGKPAFVNSFALTEGDPKELGNTPYSKTVDKRGALVATEIQNNGFKLAKFVATAHLSGADSIRLGFVSRASSSSSDRHNLLAAQHYKPQNLAHQMSLATTNMWGIVKWIVMLVRQHAANLRGEESEDEFMAKFVMVRDANAPLLTLYNVPFDLFDDEDEDEEGDESSDEEGGAAAAAGSA